MQNRAFLSKTAYLTGRELPPRVAFASLILPTALRLWAPPVYEATGGHGPRGQLPAGDTKTFKKKRPT